MQDRGTIPGGNVSHVTIRALGSQTRGDAAGLTSVRRGGSRGLADRHDLVHGELTRGALLGASFRTSTLRAKGALLATRGVGFSCKGSPL